MNYTYIFECDDGSYYTGWTNHLEKRFQMHKKGKGAKYTRIHKPIKIAYYEEFENKTDAMKREYEIKQFTHKEKENLIKNSMKEEMV